MKKRLSKKHKKLLPIIGAGIVLATFVVKEALREDLKDFVDAIDSAAGVFVIRGDFNSTAFQLRVIEQKIDRVEQVTTSTTKDPFTLLVVNQQMMIFRELHEGAESSLDNAFRLSQKFPNGRKITYQSEISKLRADLEEARKAFREEGVVVARASSRIGPDLVPIGEDRISIANATTGLFNQTNSLLTSVQALSTKILREADEIEERKQKRYDFLTKGSYLLFGIGWLLGLIGKLLGVDAIDAG